MQKPKRADPQQIAPHQEPVEILKKAGEQLTGSQGSRQEIGETEGQELSVKVQDSGIQEEKKQQEQEEEKTKRILQAYHTELKEISELQKKRQAELKARREEGGEEEVGEKKKWTPLQEPPTKPSRKPYIGEKPNQAGIGPEVFRRQRQTEAKGGRES